MVREKWLDAVKGFAILLVVLGHFYDVVDSKQIFAGTEINHLIYSIHMVLFFVVSGYLSCSRIFTHKPKEAKKYILRRGIQLLVPLFFFFSINTIWYWGYYCNFDLTQIFSSALRIAQSLWFILVLLVITIIIPVLNVYFSEKQMLIFFSIGWILSGLINNTLCTLIAYFLAFLFGKFLNNVLVKKESTKWLKVNQIFYFFAIIYIFTLVAHFYLYEGKTVTNGYFKVLMGIPGSYLILTLFLHVYCHCDFRILSYIGQYSLPIFFMHAWMMRFMIFKLTQMSFNIYIIWVLNLVLGCALPILVYHLFEKNKFLDFVFHPTKYMDHSKIGGKLWG